MKSKGQIDPHIHPYPHRSTIRLAIINAVRYHGEIWYSYMYIAGVLCRWNVSLFTVFSPPTIENDNGFFYLTRSWSRPFFSTPPQHIDQLLQSNATLCSYQIIIICTPEFSKWQHILNALLNQCHQHTSYLLLLQIHRARRDIPNFERVLRTVPTLRMQRRVEVRYLVLAEHVKKSAERQMTLQIEVDIWRSGFPLDLPAHAEEDDYHQYYDFAVQGQLDDKRRNYSGLIADIRDQRRTLEQHRVIFTIVGSTLTFTDLTYMKIPGVRLFVSPNYMPANVYFSFIHQSFGLLPIFGGESYYTDVMSSSITAALLTQTPLLASPRLLDSHEYIPQEAVWFQYPNETDVAAVLRIVQSFRSRAVFRKVLFNKRQQLKRLLEDSYRTNVRTLHRYASQIEL